MKQHVYEIAFVGVLLLCIAGESPAQGLFRYVDDAGVVHFTDTPVDRRFRRVAITEDGLWSGWGRPAEAPNYGGYDLLIVRVAGAYDLEPSLVKAVIAAESNFDHRAVSRAGALGLMQLMPRTAAEMGVENPFQPDENVLGGARYLRLLFDRYGDLSRALAAYNAGPEAVDRYQGIPPYRETQAYVERVLAYYRRYHGDFGR